MQIWQKGNPSGLNDPNHYTCAFDMAHIAKEAYRNKTFLEIENRKKKRWMIRQIIEQSEWFQQFYWFRLNEEDYEDKEATN